MLPALKIETPRDRLADIQRTMRRFISPILVNSVLGKALADRGQLSPSRLTHADLEALVADEVQGPREFFKLIDIQVTCGTMGLPTAKICSPTARSLHMRSGAGSPQPPIPGAMTTARSWVRE